MPTTRLVAAATPHMLPAAARGDLAGAPALNAPDVCAILGTTYSNNQLTRIGELHVAPLAGMNGTYSYNTQADSSMSVGYTPNTGSYSVGGTVGVDNSIGAGGSSTHSNWANYINDRMNYEKIENSCYTLIQPYSSNGNVADNTTAARPGTNPWGKCESAPFFAEIQTGGHTWGSLNSTSINESWSFAAFGLFQGSGSTGYTTTNQVSYVNNGSKTTWVCGAGGAGEGLPGSPVIYNSLS